MAWYRQVSQPLQAGELDSSTIKDLRVSLSIHEHEKTREQKGHSGLAGTRLMKGKRLARPTRNRQYSIGLFVVLLLVFMILSILGADYLFVAIRTLRGEALSSSLPGALDEDYLQFYDPKLESGAVSFKNANALAEEKRMQFNNDAYTHKGKEDFEKKQATLGARKKKHSAVACDIAFANATNGVQELKDISNFQSFSLTYIMEDENLQGDPSWMPKFAGHQSLMQREESYLAKDQTVHCGFVKGHEEYPATGFELSKDDTDYLQTCHIAVSSCIFGNYDHIRNPASKKISSSSKEKVCFAMFVDQQSLDGMVKDGEVPDKNMTVGLWRILLIKNLPYPDNRRTGKVPKFLTHRLFPNAKYSIWLDSKLRLQSDPLAILEYFLWRGRHEYAISNHYDRHCVWEEVAQNKKLNKFNHTVIDKQFAFYQKDGLIRFNASDPHKLLPSHVPEGSFIVRAHTPMSNLFSCLWFNEVERFTSRDQLSFAYTYLKFVRMNPSKKFHFHMFKDCERKAMAKLYHHKEEEVASNVKL